MIPQLKKVQRERPGQPRQQTVEEARASAIARGIIRALQLKDETDTWRTIRRVVLEYLVEPKESKGQGANQ